MVVTRFAPSPTGSLHIGSVRTALYAYAMAKANNGKFILRIEDTDAKRTVQGSEQDIKKTLNKFDITWDELYKQSDRLGLYQEYAHKLVDNDYAFYCFTSAEELAKIKEDNAENKNFIFRSPYRDMAVEEARKKKESGEKYVVRLKVPANRELTFADSVHGTMKFNTADVSDAVLLKSDGFPTYHLAVVVDDTLMGVTHVFRAVEWLPSVPKHILIYEGLNIPMPKIAHPTTVLNQDGDGKLSKRKGAVAAKDFLAEGYLADAISNYIMTLGWSPTIKRQHGEAEREVFSMAEICSMFDIKDLNKSNPRFNLEKLVWFNKEHMRAMSLDALQNATANWLKNYRNDSELNSSIIDKGPDFMQRAVALVKDKVKTLAELVDSLEIFYKALEAQDKSEIKHLANIEDAKLKLILTDCKLFLNKFAATQLTDEAFQTEVKQIAEAYEVPAGVVFMGMRIAITRRMISPHLTDFINVIGVAESTKRIDEYIA